MFRNSVKSLAVAAALALTPMAAQADVFTSSLTFEGGGLHDQIDRFTLTDFETAIGNGLDFSSDPTLEADLVSALGSDAFSLGLAIFATGGVLDLPGVDEPATWTVSAGIELEASYTVDSGPAGLLTFPFGFAGGGSLDINDELGIPPFSINDAAGLLGASFLDEADLVSTILGLLSTVELNIFEDTTALILSDDIADFPALVVLTTDDNPIEEAVLFIDDLLPGLLPGDIVSLVPSIIASDSSFAGELGLEAVTRDVVVSEPATLALLGFGLAGFAVARRRR